MIRLVLFILSLLLGANAAYAQGNVCRTSPPGASTVYCASEAFVTLSRGTLTPQAFATLPACSASTEGQTADVTDSSTTLYGATITGGGSAHVFAYCNGTNWTVMGGTIPPAGSVLTFTGDHTIATTDCFNLVQMGTGSSGKHTLTLPASPLSNGFTSPCPVSVYNGNTTTLSGLLLSGVPSSCLNSRYNLAPGQTISFEISGSAGNPWAVTGCPGRYTPAAAMVLKFANAGSDTTGDGFTDPFQSINRCFDAFADSVDYSSDFTQPNCQGVCGETYVESDLWVIPMHGTNTLTVSCAGGSGSVLHWKPAGANPSALVAGNFANLQITGVDFSGTGTTCFSASCALVSLHNGSVFEPQANVSCTDAGAGGTCFKTDINTAGGAHINVDNGLTVSGTIGNIFNLNGGASMIFNGNLTASGGLTLSQVIAGIGGGVNIAFQGNFTTSGAFGTARQWAILNNAVLCNVSGTAVPGSTPGINTVATFANGIIVNSGTGAGGC